MRLLALIALCAAGASAGMAPVKPGVTGRAHWSYTVIDGRSLYKPAKSAPGTFEAVEVHQAFRVEADGTGALKNTLFPAGQSEVVTDDGVAGKDFDGHDRIRIYQDRSGASFVELDFQIAHREGSEMAGVETRYSLPLKPFGNGWAVPAAAATHHFTEQARMQAQADISHLKADGWRVSSLKAAFIPPKTEEALRLVPEDGGWRLIASVPFVLMVDTRLSR